ncbi:hypothetical protein P153DRAFT_383479 [Dothidotthia symphoricarpi CBS 119687]|uniref:Uncharacterized protein n=1 Tax=Dothidotthia symphoricarpi CBS 119687 TaxID=1392245 RepID=A0A6A6AJS5_9PLEO|nr:uncharacterized protein P153DRAFT_383479 [Dothidotthia symphoricarpi CBS 119687]KAF2131368.1 hypothetical protein P153DRAFT_383479 [Dothidotthia symphoricarpi CBS 119687]
MPASIGLAMRIGMFLSNLSSTSTCGSVTKSIETETRSLMGVFELYCMDNKINHFWNNSGGESDSTEINKG